MRSHRVKDVIFVKFCGILAHVAVKILKVLITHRWDKEVF